jgi:hypothetical protein
MVKGQKSKLMVKGQKSSNVNKSNVPFISWFWRMHLPEKQSLVRRPGGTWIRYTDTNLYEH